jgi:hypothetical protein
MAVKGRLIPVPNLDDRDWRAIKDDIVRAIPKRAPEWTDHNLSDPRRSARPLSVGRVVTGCTTWAAWSSLTLGAGP